MSRRTFKLLVFIVLVLWLLLFTWPDLPRVRTHLTTYPCVSTTPHVWRGE